MAYRNSGALYAAQRFHHRSTLIKRVGTVIRGFDLVCDRIPMELRMGAAGGHAFVGYARSRQALRVQYDELNRRTDYTYDADNRLIRIDRAVLTSSGKAGRHNTNK